MEFKPLIDRKSSQGPSTPKEVLEEIYKLSQDEGLTDKEIGDKIGIMRESVCRIRIRYGIPSRSLENRKDVPTYCSNCGELFYKRRKDRKKRILMCDRCKTIIEQKMKGEIERVESN